MFYLYLYATQRQEFVVRNLDTGDTLTLSQASQLSAHDRARTDLKASSDAADEAPPEQHEEQEQEQESEWQDRELQKQNLGQQVLAAEAAMPAARVVNGSPNDAPGF